jgi:hypothetical protein
MFFMDQREFDRAFGTSTKQNVLPARETEEEDETQKPNGDDEGDEELYE